MGRPVSTNTKKAAVALLSAMVVTILIWIGRKFQPWMAEGRAVHVSDTHLGDFDFQAWQRKNSGASEPFTTWLFVRKQGGKWMPCMLDFEDTYRPSVVLRKENSGIAILSDNTKLGYFDERQQTFTRASDGTVFPSAQVDYEPPGNW
jgi:hypothetical protein